MTFEDEFDDFDEEDYYRNNRTPRRNNKRPGGPNIDAYIRGAVTEKSTGKLNPELKSKMLEFFNNFIDNKSVTISAQAKLIVALLSEL